jgi:hypothetical protein
MANIVPSTDPRSLRRKLITFKLIYHDGKSLVQGPHTDLLMSTADTTDVVACKVLKAFERQGETHKLMHFTEARPAGKRIIPNFFSVAEHTLVYVHVSTILRPGLEAVVAGVKRLGLITEDDVTHDLKRLRVDDEGR